MSTTTLNEAIINIQTTMDLFTKKSGKNTMGKGYSYFTETDLYNALKPAMKKEGIGYTLELEGEADIKQIGNMWYFGSKGFLKIFKGEEQKNLQVFLTAMNTDPAKAMGSALTYGARYWLCKEFGIATDELDPDTTEVSNKIKEAPKNKKLESQEAFQNAEAIGENDNFVEQFCIKMRNEKMNKAVTFLMEKTKTDSVKGMKSVLKTLSIEDLSILKEAALAKEGK